MTWEELAKFIMEMPEAERKRPVFKVLSLFVGRKPTEIAEATELISRARLHEFPREALRGELLEGDWVIE